MRRLIDLAVFTACVGVAMTGCADAAAYRVRLDPAVRRPDRSVVIFFVDGMDRGRLERLLSDGSLPNIERRFVRAGVGVEHAISSMPALTYPNAVSLLTGLFPGHHGILGNRWFDRHTLRYQDYGSASTYRRVNEDFSAPTLFERLRDRFTVNVQCHTRRGVTWTIDNWAESGIDWLFGNYSGVDARVGRRIERVSDIANQVGRWPVVLLNYFPGVDEVGHRFGVESSQYARAMQIVDAQIGSVMDSLDRAGPAGETWFVLVTDHGHIQRGPNHHLRLIRLLKRECGLNVYLGGVTPSRYPDRYRALRDYDAVVLNGAFRRASIHLRGPAGWSDRPSVQTIERVLNLGRAPKEGFAPDPASSPARLAQLPGVELICVRGGAGRVSVVHRAGQFHIERRFREGRPVYRWIEPPVDAEGPIDPLGYREDPELAAFVDAGWHGSREWLAVTAATRFPDFVPQVVEMFDSPRAGDIVVFAASDWSFGGPDLSGHGSCLATDMRVPMYFAGPSLPRGGRIHHGRLVDVMPTVLDLLGEAGRLDQFGPIDGVSLKSELKAAQRKATPADAKAEKASDEN